MPSDIKHRYQKGPVMKKDNPHVEEGVQWPALMKATHRHSLDASAKKDIAEKASKLYSRDHDEPLYINVDTGAAMRREDLPQDSEIID
ncbi:predicted protein [Lichtheimia corymbifera JMRC:FSU:9682]|uniref:Uncharacterized protein n=1 Tax=Lichtheimia corymbifera JMRC:FSU:9682 TaxID=1263082 RepID=A0A068SCS4_9FUNG|nr:predicted protein [Lichtheimia corymbifera JMRC:FSU:9682]